MNASRLRSGMLVAVVALLSLLAVAVFKQASNQLTLTNEYELAVDA